MKYKSDLIYPEINIKEEDRKLADKLINIYSGRNSIINNILTYLYQTSILDNNTSNIINNIIDVEFLHAKIISKIIFKLGIKPRYIQKTINGYKYFNPSYINYNTNIIEILNNNIILKEELINDCNNIINVSDNENIKEILNRIIIDEKLHLKIFKELLTNQKKQV